MDLRYEPMERLSVSRPVNRIAYLKALCRGRSVLDLGALDETAFGVKKGRGTWLHEELATSARQVIGLDNSSKVPVNGLRTAPNAEIIHGQLESIAAILADRGFVPDVVVAGELIEHLQDPQGFLTSIAREPALKGCELLLTTPNATALHNVLVGLIARESTHKDHLCILSFKTLNTLCKRAGFQTWTIVPYRAAFLEMRARHEGLANMGIAATERMINVGEWLFPLLSFGYIVRVQL